MDGWLGDAGPRAEGAGGAAGGEGPPGTRDVVDGPVDRSRQLPDAQLRLEWVYGYRGSQCRNNLHITASGDLVYFVAGVGVVLSTSRAGGRGDATVRTSPSQKFYFGHNDDIISLALHPKAVLTATGQVGAHPRICVWDNQTMETASLMHGIHQRGVAALSFGGLGDKFLASCGLEDDHVIAVWDWKKGTCLAQIKGHSERVFDLHFNPFEETQLASCGVKHVKFWTLSGNTLAGKRGVFGKAGEIKTQLCLAFGRNKTTYTGTLDGDINVWHGNSLAEVLSGAHASAIFSIYSSADGFATGSKDGTVRLWSIDFDPVTTIDVAGSKQAGYRGLSVRSVCWLEDRVLLGTQDGEIFEVIAAQEPVAIIQSHGEGVLWGLATHPSEPWFLTASHDCTARLWLAETHELLGTVTLPAGAQSAAFHPSGSLAAIGLADGSFLVVDIPSLRNVDHVRCQKDTLHELQFSPDGQLLAVGSDDAVDIFDAAFKKVTTFPKFPGYVCHIDFSADSAVIRTNAGGSRQCQKLIRLADGKELPSYDGTWATNTAVLDPGLKGIWKKYAKADDINAVDVGPRIAVTGDDFGKVKLFSFPASSKGAKYREYVGPSDHVTCVRFSHDYSRVVTTGGADRSIFQWRVHLQGAKARGPYDSHSEKEDTDTDGSVDSDVERENTTSYVRTKYKADLTQLSAAATKGITRLRAPDNSLSLNFVHGYRGYDCRNNLFFSPQGAIIYHVAAIGIVYDQESHTQQHYTMHTDDILSLALHPSGKFVATGQIGREPNIHVWGTQDLKTMSVLKGFHERGVCALDFSANGKRLVSVGLGDNHMIAVWDWAKGTRLATTRGHKDKIFVIRFNPYNAELVTVGVKHIKFWQQAGGGFTSKRGIFGKVGKIDTSLCIAFSNDKETVFTGSTKGLILHWKGSNLVGKTEAHTGPVYSIFTAGKGFVTGGKDGGLCLWNEGLTTCLQKFPIESSRLTSGSAPLVHEKPCVRAICLAQDRIIVGTTSGDILQLDRSGAVTVVTQGHGEGEVWGLATHPTKRMAATASDDKTLRVWDIEHHTLLKFKKLKSAARACAFSIDGSVIAVGTDKGEVMLFDADTMAEKVAVHHRKESISDIKFSPNGRFMAVASHDNFVDIYDRVKHKRVGICKGASSYITHVDWDVEGKLLVLNSGAKERLYYEAPRGIRQNLSEDVLAEMEWHTWTGVLGDKCKGIWPLHSDITDVNSTDLNHARQVLATGDDLGLVKLFEFPTTGKFAKFKKYMGHSAHVTNVRWLCDDSKLMSTGGNDTAVCVWDFTGSAVRSGGDGPRVRRKSAMLSAAGDSDDSNTDSEEEGYDSTVDWEKKIDYSDKTYTVVDSGKLNKHSGGPRSAGRKKVSRSKAKNQSVVRQGHRAPRDGKKSGAKMSLRLEYIFGYRGYDCRDNIGLTPEGYLVYHAAGTGIVFDTSRQKQKFYVEHTDDIISLAMNPCAKFGTVCATGQIGGKPQICVWDTTSLQTLSTIRGVHETGVCCVDFSQSGKLLLGVGLGPQTSMAVYRWSTGQVMARTSVNHGKRVFCAKFRPDSEHLIVTCGTKHIKFWALAGNQLVGKRGILPRDMKMSTQCSIAFGPPGITYSGSANGQILVWDHNQLLQMVGPEQGGHARAILSMFTVPESEGGGICSAGKDGVIKMWGPDLTRPRNLKLPAGVIARCIIKGGGRSGKVLVGTSSNEIYEASGNAWSALVSGHGAGELWGLSIHPSQNLFATGSEDKLLRMWDVKSRRMLRSKTLSDGIRSVNISPNGDYIAVGMSQGGVQLLRTENLEEISSVRDRNGPINDLEFSPDSKVLVVGSSEQGVDFYSLQPFRRIGYKNGLNGDVIHVDWARSGSLIQLNTTEHDHLYLDAPSGEVIAKGDLPSDTVWATWNSVLGKNIHGIWPKTTDKGLINCVDVSHCGTKAVTGDDYGLVKLFDFPCEQDHAKHQKFYGHSAHVTNVRFSHDDSYVISCGGDDSCVFLWKVI